MSHIDECCKKMSEISGERILIFGGSGSLGKTTIQRWIKSNTIINVSRDEEKQWQLRSEINNQDLTQIIGDISQEEMMREATEMLRKMKEMGGDSKQMTEMFQNMAKSMGMGGKNVKVDTNAMNRMVKQQSIKDRLRAKLEQKKQQDFELKQLAENVNNLVQNYILKKIF
jgi:NADPH:quinone reductase-like Zn-dependent oxidoreductase